jgi:hypothetical protein
VPQANSDFATADMVIDFAQWVEKFEQSMKRLELGRVPTARLNSVVSEVEAPPFTVHPGTL